MHVTPEQYYLDTPHTLPNGKPLFFGAARTGKQHVSFHLIPVYVFPELLDRVSEALRKRMQGESCFNLKTPAAALLAELAEFTRRGHDRYLEVGYVG